MNPRWYTLLKEYAEALIIALLLAMVIRGFVVKAYKIPSGSMLQTLQIGDHLLVNRFCYGLKIPFTNKIFWSGDEPKFGEIIVFEFPPDPTKDYIKRVIGVPGDSIEVRDKAVYRNGEKLNEGYIQHTDPRNAGSPRDDFGPIKVPENSYFVLGDNRDESFDSRFWGFVPREKIEGRAWVIYWSWSGFSEIRWNRLGNGVR